MHKFRLLSTVFVALLFALAFGLVVPSGSSSAVAEEEEEGDDEGGEEEGGEFFEDETTFSGKQVTRAIDKGVSWLRKNQAATGSWGPMKYGGTYSGEGGESEADPSSLTSLALYALLKCKQPLKDPVIKKGFNFIFKNYKKPRNSYCVSMLLLAVTATANQAKMSKTMKKMPKPKLAGRYRSWATTLAKYLVGKRSARGWRYNKSPGEPSPEASGGDEDLSSTQLAALALFAAHRAGIKVKDQVWEDILSFSLDQQEEDGPEVTYTDPVDPKRKRTANSRGFCYVKGFDHQGDDKASGGMTACGIANIEMARFVLSRGGKKRDEWNKRPDAKKVQTAIFDGLAWLDKNWQPFVNPGKPRGHPYHVYWLYALERSMDLLDLKLVGSHRWYNEMGQELLNRQNSDGHWNSVGSGADHRNRLDTSFALLFLKRATKGSIPFGSVTGGSEDPPADNR